MAEHTDLIISTAETVLQTVRTRAQQSGANDPESFRKIMSTVSVYNALRESCASFKSIDAVSLVDAQGEYINTSRYYPVSGMNVSDQDYFKVLQADSRLRLYISEPVRSKGGDKWAFTLSSPLNDDQGRFMGLVVVSLSKDYLDDEFENLVERLGEGTSISLYRNDAVLLARFPAVHKGAAFGNKQHAAGLLGELLTGNGVQITADRPLLHQGEGPSSIVTVNRLQRFPLAVAVEVNKKLILQNWWPIVSVVLLAVVLSIAATVLPLVLLSNIMKQREFDLAELERLNTDIMLRQATQSRLEHDASHDELTGLPRMSLLGDRLEQALLKAQRYRLMVGVIFLDLDHFKEINDTLGHQAGDELLRQVATRLSSALRQIDTVARYGGDEFVVLLSEVSDFAKMLSVAEKLRAVLAEPFMLSGTQHKVTASLGLASYPQDAATGDELLRQADKRMYQAKSLGRNRVASSV